MDRSLWFRVCYIRLLALFRLAFASAPRLPLNLAGYTNSPVHSSIGTPSHSYRAPTACRHTVSGSLSFPSRGSFHRSLSVLFAIGPYQYFALEGGPPCFPQGSSCPVVLRMLPHSLRCAYRALTVFGSGSHLLRLPPRMSLVVLYPVSVSRSGLGSALFARRYYGHLC